MRHGHRVVLLSALLAASLAACVERRALSPQSASPEQGRELISRSLPANASDRAGWTADIYAGFIALGIEVTPPNVCAVTAIIAQESGFRVDPAIPDLGKIAWQEIDRRAEHALIPSAVVHGVLQLKSPDGRTYSDRIDSARTEKDLSDIYEDFIGSVPLGRTLFENRNPIRTRGPMQVNVAFAERFAASRTYPYPVKVSIADELFTRRGSVYFGIAHLLAYRAPYDQYRYRFADYNAGQFSSRNAAFQEALSTAAHVALVPDGALLPRDEIGLSVGDTESAARTLGPRLELSRSEIHRALEQGRAEDFEGSALYRRTFALANQGSGHDLPRAVVPHIELVGPKLSRKLTTSWYANRVEARFNRCLNSGG
jgi:hypothetical protein